MRTFTIIILVIFTVLLLPLKLLLPRDLYERLGEKFFDSLIGQLIVICLLHLFFDDFMESLYPIHGSTRYKMESSIAKNEAFKSPLYAVDFDSHKKSQNIQMIFEKPSDYK